MQTIKKYLVAIALVLALPVVTLAAFSPVTLTNGISRIAVFSETQAKALFGQGYQLETKSIGAITGPNVLYDMIFNKSVKMKEPVAFIAKTAVSATTTLSARDSGTTYYLTASGTTIYLPVATAAAGATYRFVVKGALDSGNVMITSQTGDDIDGTLIVAGAVVDCDAVDALNIIVDGENVGDFVELRSDGVKWFIGESGVLTTAKMTCTG